MENLKQEKTICDKCGEPIDNMQRSRKGET